MAEAKVYRPYLLPDGHTTRILELRACICVNPLRGWSWGICGNCNGASPSYKKEINLIDLK
jgi:hypothetical protein